jgi:hypothetical protein
MASTSSDARSAPAELAIYYGPGRLPELQRFGRVVLQPDHFTARQLTQLKASGTQPLAYLSLGEDTGPAAPWHRPQTNPVWGGHYVIVSHPHWQDGILRVAAGHLERGFSGLFLDTLDTSALFPEDRAALLTLIRNLRSLLQERYLLANRGFGLLPELASLVDGCVFESFSATWSGSGYRALTSSELQGNLELAYALQDSNLDLYALDYADTAELAAFARARARTHGFTPVIGNRNLTRL